MVGQLAWGTPPPVSPQLEPGCRGRQPPLDPKLHRLDGKKSEGRTGLLHSYDSTEGTQRYTDRIRPTVTVELTSNQEKRKELSCVPLLSSYAVVLSGLRCVDPSPSPGRSSCSAAPCSGPTCCSAPGYDGYEPETHSVTSVTHFVKTISDQKHLNVLLKEGDYEMMKFTCSSW